MPDTFTQLYTHIVFAVKDFQSFIDSKKEPDIYQVLDDVITKTGHKSLIIDGTENHVHILIKQNPLHAISDLVREVKRQSSYFINHHLLKVPSFHWQHGYYAFSHIRSQVNAVYKYIEKQKEYHKMNDFKEEYIEMNNLLNNDESEGNIFKYKYQ